MKNIDELLRESKKIHFIGIGGAGMCPIAEILLSLGYTLTGSETTIQKPSDELKRRVQRFFSVKSLKTSATTPSL